MTTVGFIGLGQIGAPMAQRLAGWPDGLVVHDLRDEATKPFADLGATVATSVAELGAAADVISVMVLDDEQVRAVVAELLTTARSGTVIAVHSTVRADTVEELGQVAATSGVHVLDAPVSGGFIGAHDGTLAVLVGGERAAFELAREPFERFASLVVHFGPVGAGTRAKLARNLMHFIAYTGATEAQRLAEAAGLDLLKLGQVVRHSDAVTGGAGAIMVRPTAAPLNPDDGLYDIFCHTRSLAEKDLELALELGAGLGVELPLGHLALERFAAGLGVPHPPGG
ncbi:MAG TPA: NAD(P)-dependent oxidoreductase [Acidimicrobiales bacterium]